MAKLEVSDDQLKKFMDEATKAKVKELEAEVKKLEMKLKRKDATIANLKDELATEGRAVERLNQIADSLIADGWTTREDW